MKDAALPIRSASFTVTSRTGHCSFLFLLQWVNYRLKHQRTENMKYILKPFSLDHIRGTVYPFRQKNPRSENWKGREADKNWGSIKSYAPIRLIRRFASESNLAIKFIREGSLFLFFREYETTGCLHTSELWMPIVVCWRLLIVNLFTVLGDHWWSYMVMCVYVWHHLSKWFKKK